MRILGIVFVVCFTSLLNAQVLFNEDFSDISRWVVIENEDGLGGFVTDGDIATLTMDGWNHSTRIQDEGTDKMFILDTTGHIELVVTELTGGNQRVFVHVEEFTRISSQYYTYISQKQVLAPQTTAGTYVVNFDQVNWSAGATHIRFRIGGANWSANQGTIKMDRFTYYGYPSTTNIFTGNVSSDWSDPDNWTQWEEPTVPKFDKVIVQASAGEAIVSADVEIDTLIIEAGATVTVNGGATLSLKSDLYQNGTINNQGTIAFRGTGEQHLYGNLTSDGIVSVEAGAILNTHNTLGLTGTGALLHGQNTPNGGGLLKGKITCYQYGANSPVVYNYWSAPIGTATTNNLGGYVYAYDATQANPTVLDGWVHATGSLTVGKGYATTGADTVTFFGTPNDSTVKVNVSAANSGYNLVGNPYPSMIDYDAFLVNNANNMNTIEGTLYFWDDDSSNAAGWASSDYAMYNALGYVSGTGNGKVPTGKIAVGQGFFVKAIQNGEVEFTNDMRSGEESVFFRNSSYPKMKMSLSNTNNAYNEMLVAFHPNATSGFDNLYDGRKLPGNNVAGIYTLMDTTALSIQGLPSLTAEQHVPLVVEVDQAGSYTLNAFQIDGFDSYSRILLEDKELGSMVVLNDQSTHQVNLQAGISDQRFVLHFLPAPQIEATNNSCSSELGELSVNAHSKLWVQAQVLGNMPVELLNGTATISHLQAGANQLLLTDSLGNTMQVPFEVTEPVAVHAEITTADNAHVGEEVMFTSEHSGNGNMQWEVEGNTIETTGTTSYTFNEVGAYWVTLRLSNNDCSVSTSKLIVVTELINSISTPTHEQLKDVLIIHMDNGNIKLKNLPSNTNVELTDLAGKKLWKSISANDQLVIATDMLPVGVYIVSAANGGNISTQQVRVIR